MDISLILETLSFFALLACAWLVFNRADKIHSNERRGYVALGMIAVLLAFNRFMMMTGAVNSHSILIFGGAIAVSIILWAVWSPHGR